MGVKIDPKVVMNLSIFKIGGWNILQPNDRKLFNKILKIMNWHLHFNIIPTPLRCNDSYVHSSHKTHPTQKCATHLHMWELSCGDFRHSANFHRQIFLLTVSKF